MISVSFMLTLSTKNPGINGGFSCTSVTDGLYKSLDVTSSLPLRFRAKNKIIIACLVYLRFNG